VRSALSRGNLRALRSRRTATPATRTIGRCNCAASSPPLWAPVIVAKAIATMFKDLGTNYRCRLNVSMRGISIRHVCTARSYRSWHSCRHVVERIVERAA
jgi:hypothetical protein